jgi:hypothetical protein
MITMNNIFLREGVTIDFPELSPQSEQNVLKQFNYICLKDSKAQRLKGSKAQRRAFYSPVGVSGDLPGLRRINFWHCEIQTIKNYYKNRLSFPHAFGGNPFINYLS